MTRARKKAEQEKRVIVRGDEIVGYGDIHIEWMDDNHVSLAINDRRFSLASRGKIRLYKDFGEGRYECAGVP